MHLKNSYSSKSRQNSKTESVIQREKYESIQDYSRIVDTMGIRKNS